MRTARPAPTHGATLRARAARAILAGGRLFLEDRHEVEHGRRNMAEAPMGDGVARKPAELGKTWDELVSQIRPRSQSPDWSHQQAPVASILIHIRALKAESGHRVLGDRLRTSGPLFRSPSSTLDHPTPKLAPQTHPMQLSLSLSDPTSWHVAASPEVCARSTVMQLAA